MNRTNFIQEIVQKAGEEVKKTLPNAGVIEKEGRANYVTAADLKSEKVIIDLIKKNFPHDTILSEETSSTLVYPLDEENLWVIDPIDGTNNFRFQRNYSCISVGFVKKGTPCLGVIYDFIHNVVFFAEKGKGAFENTKKISIGTQTALGKANVASDDSNFPDGTRKNLEILLKLNPMPWVLIKGSAALMMCEVASGRTDLYMHTGLKPWDNAAGLLIIEESGGIVRDHKGEVVPFTSPQIIAGNTTLVEQFVKQVNS